MADGLLERPHADGSLDYRAVGTRANPSLKNIVGPSCCRIQYRKAAEPAYWRNRVTGTTSATLYTRGAIGEWWADIKRNSVSPELGNPGATRAAGNRARLRLRGSSLSFVTTHHWWILPFHLEERLFIGERAEPPFKPCLRISRTRLADGLLDGACTTTGTPKLCAQGRASPRPCSIALRRDERRHSAPAHSSR